MKTFFKRIFIPLLLVTVLSGNENLLENNFVDGCLEVVYGKTNYIDVNSYSQWLSEMTRAKKNLVPQISISIAKFNEKVYDIEKLAEYNISIKATGEIIGRRAYIDYTLEYTDNYMLLRAVENPELEAKLSTEQLSTLNKLKENTQKLVTEAMTPYQKEKAIHDFMVSNYKYDIENLNTNSLTLRSHNVTGLVNDGTGVCEAYANTFMLMCKLAGIECHIVTGTVDDVKHAWNIVKLDDEYYHIDVTNNDPTPDVAGRIRYNYFNLTDEEIAKTHTIEQPQTFICTGEKYNYYTFNNLVVSDPDQLKELANKELANGKKEFTFKTKNFVLNSSTYIKQAVSNKGFTKMQVYGKFGMDNIYYVILE